MTCEAKGEPQTYHFNTWAHIGHDKQTVIRHLPGEHKQNGSQFTLTLNDSFTYEDSGYYRCNVSNGIRGRSSSIHHTNTSGYFVVEGNNKTIFLLRYIEAIIPDRVGSWK